MNIGDKVRLIHSKGEGVITKILKNDMVEVAIEDGFNTPYHRKELAIVSRIEEKYFVPKNELNNSENLPIQNQVKAQKGIFFSFVIINQHRFQLYIINNTDYHLPFCVSIVKDGINEGVGAGYLESKHFQVLKEFDTQNFESWGTFQFDCFYYRENRLPDVQVFSKKIKFRANTFSDLIADTPLLNKKGHLFQLDKEEPMTINAAELKNKMFEKQNEKIDISNKPTTIIDLHIEELEKNNLSFNHSKPILSIQLDEFEKNLELAIAHGMDEITFIHGVGNGILRDEIHRRLGRHKNVAYFKDAQKDKFGYGATLAKIK